ncbi:MAG TPA: preprotein translocase subunit SecE [Gaiellaceae bacterium]|nr:preprotein translocase subunit SecE [Gaiellaceae bacterium]
MAGETRRQRRDARRAAGDGAAPSPGPARAQTVPAEPVAVEHHRRGGFVRESWGELKKVDWPNRAQVIQGTVVVLIACAVVGAYLWGVDQALRPFVRDVLLGQ